MSAAQALLVALARFGAVALAVAHVHELGDDGDGQLGVFVPRTSGRWGLDALPVLLGGAGGQHQLAHAIVPCRRSPSCRRNARGARRLPDAARGRTCGPRVSTRIRNPRERRPTARARQVHRLEHDAPRRRESALRSRRPDRVVDHRHGEAHTWSASAATSLAASDAPSSQTCTWSNRGTLAQVRPSNCSLYIEAARDAHLERVAGRVWPRRHDLLRVVAEEHERLAVGRSPVCACLFVTSLSVLR